MRTAQFLLIAGLLAPVAVRAQINVSGVADKSTYNNSVTFTIGTQAGYDYNATLNWQPIATTVPVTVGPDFYELRVDATNQVTSAVSSLYRRFIVMATERGDTERGLPTHVPFPVIQSSPHEFSGAHLRVTVPASFPAGYSVPLVAWAVDEEGHAIRGNGLLKNSGATLFQLKRGAGSGLLAPPPGISALELNLEMGGLSTNRTVIIESNINWQSVSGVLNGNTAWPANSRIHVTGSITIPSGSSLVVGAGTVVRLDGRVDITNNGVVTIEGAITNPVVFLPAVGGEPWGGFIQHANNTALNVTGAIFTGSGAESCWFGGHGRTCGVSGIDSHLGEQGLFSLRGANCNVTMTDSAAIALAGQLGHGVGSGGVPVIRLTRFLLQGATSGGEYTRSTLIVNDSALIDFPEDSATFVNEDYDALYLVDGPHFFTNTLFGWTKDDGIDSGGSGYGPITYQSCWFEATFHEGNSLSGFKNVLTRGTVYFNCGQGIEGGYDAPTSRVDTCFFSMCQSGIRHGDNYETFSQYTGRMIATNNISIYNHRDLFGFNWDNSNSGGWTNNYANFFPSNNLVSALDTNYPNNTLWNPANDGWRLSAFGGVSRAGVGFGIRTGQSSLAQFPDGIPVGLSRFCTNEVTVNYEIDGTDGTHVSGTLVFPAGLTRRHITAPTSVTGVLRIALKDPVNADVTGSPALLFQNLPPSTNDPAAVVISPLGATWKYLDDGSEQGAAWASTDFNDSAWASGPARLGFGSDPAPLATTLRRYVQDGGVNTSRQVTNFYFRRTFVATNPAEFATLQFRHQRDDGCVVYLNGREMFRNNMAPGPVTANTFASGTASSSSDALQFRTNILSATNLLAGTNVIAAEVHQATATSSDIGWEMELQALPEPAPPRINVVLLGADAVLYWNSPIYSLEEADVVTGPWRTASPSSPSASPATGTRFFRLKK